MSSSRGAYDRIIEHVFLSHHSAGTTEVTFRREELAQAAEQLGVAVPKNLGDVIYTFRFRRPLPGSIRERAPHGTSWIIRLAGSSQYRFVATQLTEIRPTPGLVETRIPDATPGVIAMYALGDEQALLARLRYNRLLDVFLGIACYSLQSHLRTHVADLGQIETDELYVGIDRRGAHFVVPVQAKGGRDTLSIVQIEQDFALCYARFPGLLPRPVAAQFMRDDLIALFEFEDDGREIRIANERHYRLSQPDQISADELRSYAERTR